MTAEAVKKKLELAIEAFSDERIRWFTGKSRELVESGVLDEATLDRIVRVLIEGELTTHAILFELERGGTMTDGELSKATGLSIDEIRRCLTVLRILKEVSVVGEKEGQPLYAPSLITEERRRCPCEMLIRLLLER